MKTTISSPYLSSPTEMGLPFLEALEARIAPAVLFMGTDGSIKDSTGNPVAAHATNDMVGADNALLLKSGDRLVFDSDNNHVAAKTEQTIFSVSKGAAVLYFKDLPGGLPMDIAGVATTGAFKGVSGTDIFGDIATVLALQGKGKAQSASFSQSGQGLNLVPGTGIDGLTVNGFVDGSIVSSGKMAKINISGTVLGLRAGTGANDLNSLDLGGNTPLSLADFAPPARAAGAGIQGVQVGSISFIASGDGGVGAVAAGAGGDISGITISNQNDQDLTLKSGSGGSPDGGKSGVGKAGGTISDVTIGGATSSLTIITGNGGAGDSGFDPGPGGSGGAGGSVNNVSSTVYGTLIITTGAGGDAGTPFSDQAVNKPGGAGGSVSGLSMAIYSGATGSVAIQLGDSGAGGGKVSGGSLHSSTFRGEVSDLSIIAGNGGDSIQGLSGASGGSIGGWNQALYIEAAISGELRLVAGNGGATSAIFDYNLGNLKAVGKGGDGGQIEYSTGFDSTVGSLYLQTGDAGSGAFVGAAGKAYGFVQGFNNVWYPHYSATGEVTLVTGNGADGTRFASSGGNVENVMIVGSKISIVTGEGGAAGAIDTFKGDFQVSRTALTGAGNGGFIRNLQIGGPGDANGTLGAPQEISLVTGAGGDASSAVSWKYNPANDKTTLLNAMDGGDAGDVAFIKVMDGTSLEGAVTDFTISTGTNVNNAPHAGGGDGGQQDTGTGGVAGFRQAKPTGFGGDGGNIGDVTAAIKGQANFTTSDGGKSGNMLFNLKSKFGPAPSGGLAGEITRVILQGFEGSSVNMTTGNGGSGLGSSRDGGKTSVFLNGVFDSVELTTGDGAVGRTVEFPGFEAVGGTNGGSGGRHGLYIDGNIGSLVLTTGNGGAAPEGSLLRGGSGGDIAHNVQMSGTSLLGDVTMQAGEGGDSGNGRGGSGGSINSLDLKVSGQVKLESGASGQSGSSGAGGFGNSSGSGVADITFRATGDSAEVTIISSDGFDETNETWAASPASPDYGFAGDGGWISGINFAEGTFAGVTLQTGNGGDGASWGGEGGFVTAISLASAASVDSFVIQAGDGGDGTTGGGPGNGSKRGAAGAGGSISGETSIFGLDRKFSLLGTINSLVIEAGDGGDSPTDWGQGGTGGYISKIASIIASGGSLQLKAGTGGSSADFSDNPFRYGSGGSGGAIQDIVVSGPLPDTLISSIDLQAGQGGGVLSAFSYPGRGGSITKFDSSGLVAESIDILAGDGANALEYTTGGQGGNLTDITAVYSNTSNTMVGSGGLGGIAPGEDGTATNVVISDVSNSS